MNLINVEKVSKGKCECGKKASKKINDVLYCPGCGDSLLLMSAYTAIKAVEQASVKISVLPKSKKVLTMEKKNARKKVI